MKIPNAENHDSSTPLGDVVFNLVVILIFLILFLLILPKEKKKDESQNVQIGGNIAVSVRWPDGQPQDIDLWVQGPDGIPVGYSNRTSRTWSYLRDDLGTDVFSPENYELAVTQGVPMGKYVINLHFFSNHGGPLNVPVQAEVILKATQVADKEIIFKGEVIIKNTGDEITVVQFQIDENRSLIKNSVSDKFEPVRNKPRFIGG